MIEPFHIAISDEVLKDLRERLLRARVPEGIPEYGWKQGTEPGYLTGLLTYWREGYDWRANERLLNGMPQFRAEADGQMLHFVHARSPHSQANPLLILHGWPGSFFEFHKVLPLLTHPEANGGTANNAFHVIAPSLPGYGFSPPPRLPGASPRQIASCLQKLMSGVLGYDRFYLQGGDWGSVIASWLAFDHPQQVAGLHLNMAGLRPGLGKETPPLSEAEREFLALAKLKRSEDFGYQAIQGTRPQSLGVGLNDSPAGLAAWVLEKFREWSDCGGEVERCFTRDELITNLMLYWVTGSITSSMRIYYEFKRHDRGLPPGERVETSTAFADFPAEILRPPRSWVERAYNVVRWSKMPRGGHFAALEAPELLVADLRASF